MRLIVAPHPDDESLGCGGLLAKYGTDSHVVVLSDKDEGRLKEFTQAQSVLQTKEWDIAPFHTGTLTAQARALTGWLDGVVDRVRPDEIYLPVPSMHQDHVAAYEAGMCATRMPYSRDTWFIPSVLLYDIPSYSTDLYLTPYPWNVFESLSEEQIDLKLRAIQAYQSQAMGGDAHPATRAKEHAAYIGATRKVQYAEQFALVRQIRN